MLIVSSAYIALQIPAFQTFVGKKVLNSLNENIKGDINFDNLYLVLFNKVIINNASIQSSDGDTLFQSERIALSFNPATLLGEEININSLLVKNGYFKLHTDSLGVSNLSKVFVSEVSDNEKVIEEHIDTLEQTESQNATLCLSLKKLTIENFAFQMINEKATPLNYDSHLIDWNDLDVSDININANRIRFCDSLTANISDITLKEKSGFNLKSLTGNLIYNSKGVRIDNLKIQDDFSNIRTKYFSMGFTSAEDFNDFLNRVELGIDMDNTYFDFNTLSFFAPGLEKNKLKLYASGEMVGTISNLQSKSIKARSWSGESQLEIAASMIGLPKADETMVSFNIKNCKTTTNDIAKIVGSLSNRGPNKAIAKLAPNQTFTFNGSLDGFFEDFVAYGDLTSDIGSVHIDMLMTNNAKSKLFNFLGNLSSNRFDLGKFLNINQLGELTMNTSISAVTSPIATRSSLNIDTIAIESLNFNNYDYSNISGMGKLANSEFNGLIKSEDENLQFLFHGLLNVSKRSQISNYNFNLWLSHADLHALNFDKRDTSIVSFRTSAKLRHSKDGSLSGNVDISNLSLTNHIKEHKIGKINLGFTSKEGHYTMKLSSPLADARYSGDKPITTFVSDIQKLTLNKELNLLTNVPKFDAKIGNNYSLNLSTGDIGLISTFFISDLYIAPNSSVSLKVKDDDQINLKLKSDLIALKNNIIDKLEIEINNPQENILAEVNSELLRIGGITLNNNIIGLNIDDNKLKLGYQFSNKDVYNNRGDINVEAEILDTLTSEYNYLIDTKLSEINLQGESWKINPSTIKIKENYIDVDNLFLNNNNQNVKVDGVISTSSSDSLYVNINELNLNILNTILTSMPEAKIEGEINGNATLFGLLGEMGILLDIDGDDISMFSKPFGDLDIDTSLDRDANRFNISLLNSLDGRNPISAKGYFSNSDKRLDIKSKFDKFSIDYFKPLALSVFSDLRGELSGDIDIYGKLSELELKSDNGYLSNTGLTIDFTNVPYTLNGPFTIDEKGIHFNNIEIVDPFGNKGTVGGGVELNHFKNIEFNTRINVTNSLVLDNNETISPSFYGRAFGTGRARIVGPLSKLLLDVNVSTDNNTVLHVPLSGSTQTSQSLLTFVNVDEIKDKSNPLDSILNLNNAPKNSSELEIRIKANATPQAEVRLEINKDAGDIINARGSGIVDVVINESKGIFDIKGDYTIDEGSYNFVFMGLASKEFTVNPGGVIKFNGDIMDSDLNLTANYRTKASIEILIAESSAVGTRRNVDCGITATGKLSNPTLKFSIDIPDLDPTTKARVESALNTEDKVLKQVIALLLSGGFLPDEQSGIINNTTLLYSNASEIIANQVNTIFRQLDIPLDLSFNYQPGENQRDIFDVALSAQLFNNRVTINGNIGNKEYLTNTGSDLAGDIDVEIKIDKNGKFRVTLFSHSADQFSNYLDQTQRNGVGLVYQEEFDTFGELFRKIFWSKERREKYEQQKRQEQLDEYLRSIGQSVR